MDPTAMKTSLPRQTMGLGSTIRVRGLGIYLQNPYSTEIRTCKRPMGTEVSWRGNLFW
ncbi:uncharacterized protein BCR38DRAFT_435644 [Pseudomassariella vexata]|uniref:Uncharacterized protein n=1 Tax=Pseudomassariella vexata TaxID=1141098 RepID=A0A1Y2DUR5_9PEZI|nr:uncharacterized protein BCR38DRAFT_435644 [Pseudomassariella vexata]ORY63001.1 hypothetical protein BCR38DRAFT_435644 [Pseudomassariella vexata]